MINVQKYFMHSPGPGGANEDTNPAPKDTEKENTEETNEDREEEEHKPLGEKIKEALQDWSNKDQADQDFDDTRV